MKICFTVGVLSMAALGCAQFSENFETVSASAAGTLLTGQNGWYLPSVGGVDGNAFTYAGNTLGLASNPTGGNQFLGMSVVTANGTNRAQHAVSFASGDNWTIGYDFIGKFNGTLPAADNLGSVSLQDSTVSNYFQTIFQWLTPVDNSATATAFSANIGHFTTTGAAGGAITFESPGAAWQSLPVNHWFRQTVTWNFATGLISSTTLKDITTGGATNTFSPTGWYLAGGENNVSALPKPTDMRFFASGAAGDVMGYDNLNVSPVPEPASMTALGLGVIALIRKRRNR